MTPKRKRRLLAVLLIVVGVALSAALVLSAFKRNLMFFYSPTQIAEGKAPHNVMIRIGGLVAKHSVRHASHGLTVHFAITDRAHQVPVVYTGVLPDLFREGQGVVVQGTVGPTGVFAADTVLAKHDSKYMPPEVAAALKAAANKKRSPSVSTNLHAN